MISKANDPTDDLDSRRNGRDKIDTGASAAISVFASVFIFISLNHPVFDDLGRSRWEVGPLFVWIIGAASATGLLRLLLDDVWSGPRWPYQLVCASAVPVLVLAVSLIYVRPDSRTRQQVLTIWNGYTQRSAHRSLGSPSIEERSGPVAITCAKEQVTFGFLCLEIDPKSPRDRQVEGGFSTDYIEDDDAGGGHYEPRDCFGHSIICEIR